VRQPMSTALSNSWRQLTGIPGSPDLFICKAPQNAQHQQSQKYVRDSPNPLSHVPGLLIRNDRITIRRKVNPSTGTHHLANIQAVAMEKANTIQVKYAARWLLYLYPHLYRHEYADEMVSVFRDAHADVSAGSFKERISFRVRETFGPACWCCADLFFLTSVFIELIDGSKGEPIILGS
jgi:hypothetical protein